MQDKDSLLSRSRSRIQKYKKLWEEEMSEDIQGLGLDAHAIGDSFDDRQRLKVSSEFDSACAFRT